MSFSREDIRADIEAALKGAGFPSVWHYRFRAFDIKELPAVNILPVPDEADDGSFKTVFRRTELFRIEVLLARKTDDEDFAATSDRAYEKARKAMLTLRTCRARCPKTTILRKAWAVDDSAQVPILVVKMTVSVEFDEADD